MAVTSVTEQERRSGTDRANVRTYIRMFLVTVDDVTTTIPTVYAHADIPKLYTVWSLDTTVWAVSRSIVSHEDRLHWMVSVNYERVPAALDIGVGDEALHPTELPPRIRIGFVQRSQVVDKSYDYITVTGAAGADTDAPWRPSVAVLNSADQPFDPPLEEERSNVIITIDRNEDPGDFDPNLAIRFKDCTNSKKVTIAGMSCLAYEVKLRNVNWDVVYDDVGDPYFQTTHELEVDLHSHIRKVLDQGYYSKSGSTYTKKRDARDDPMIQQVLLDGVGGIENNPANAVFLQFGTLYPRDFAQLNLPSTETP